MQLCAAFVAKKPKTVLVHVATLQTGLRTDHVVINFRLHADPGGHGWMDLHHTLCGVQ